MSRISKSGGLLQHQNEVENASRCTEIEIGIVLKYKMKHPENDRSDVQQLW